MRFRKILFLIVLASSASLVAEISIPEKALCSVCALKGGETELEKVKAHSEHEDTPYYFCSGDCKEEFDSDPLAYIPPEFPRPAPAFTVETPQGGDKALEDLKGKVAIVDFWATWCKPCLEGMPRLQKLYNAYSGQGFEVWGVAIDEGQNRVEKIERMVDKLDISYPIFLEAKRMPAWYLFKVKAIPAMYLLDGEGRIAAQWTGKIDFEAAEKEVQRLLEERAQGDEP